MGRAKVIQADGLPRESNPVNRAMLCGAFGDGEWWTVAAMASVLTDQIPVALAARAALRVPAYAKADLETQILAGRHILVRETVCSAVGSKVFERRGSGRRREYRCIKPTAPRVCVGSKLSPDDLARPSSTTRFGIGRPQIYQIVAEHPKINFDDLITKLEPCMIDAAIDERFVAESIQQAIKKYHESEVEARQRVLAEREADPTAFLREARRFVVRMTLNDMISCKQLTEDHIFQVVEK
jgi:hypothetical protein